MMKVLFIGTDTHTAGRKEAYKNLGAEIVELAATDTTAIAAANAEFAVVSTGCAGNVEAIVKACRAAKTAMFLAQPFSANEAEATAVEALLQGYDKAVVCGQPARFVGVYRDLRKMILDDKLGTIGTIRIGRLHARSADKQPMALGMLSVLEWIFGEVEHLYAQGAPGGLDYTIVVARMKSGAIAHLEFGRTELVPYHYFEITGTGGLVEFDSRYEPEMRVTDFTKNVIRGAELLPQILWNEEAAAFIAAAKGEATSVASLTDGMRACELKRACEKSAATNTVVIV